MQIQGYISCVFWNRLDPFSRVEPDTPHAFTSQPLDLDSTRSDCSANLSMDQVSAPRTYTRSGLIDRCPLSRTITAWFDAHRLKGAGDHKDARVSPLQEGSQAAKRRFGWDLDFSGTCSEQQPLGRPQRGFVFNHCSRTCCWWLQASFLSLSLASTWWWWWWWWWWW